VALVGTPGIGPKTFFDLLAKFGTAEAVWKATPDELRLKKVTENIRKLILRRRKVIDPGLYMKSLGKMGIRVVTLLDDEYPRHLKKIDTAPPVLFVRGTLTEDDNMAIAVVGTRKPSMYGRGVTEKLVRELAAMKFTIVSGLARGIDGIAHKIALENGGRTIGFLGGGIDTIFPAEHSGLAQHIMKQGAVISEYPPGFPADRGNFPARNRLISGMCHGVLIIEGLSKSGTRHTANHAIKQGKALFVVPGQITSPLSGAPMDLYFEGAQMVRSGDDIANYLEKSGLIEERKRGGKIPKLDEVNFDSEEEKLIFSLILNEPLSSDEIVRKSTISTQEVMTLLSMMEIKEMIRSEGGIYSVVLKD
jgi:DNA processing protein